MARLLQSLRRVFGLTSSKRNPVLGAFPRSIDTDFSVFKGAFGILIDALMLLETYVRGADTSCYWFQMEIEL